MSGAVAHEGLRRMNMKLHTVVSVAMAGLSPLVLGACGGGADDVTGVTTSTRYPSVAGNWRGEWPAGARRPSAVTLKLTQNGNQLRGELTVGRDVNEITGTVTEFGELEFQGRDTDRGNGCAFYYTDPPLALTERNSELTGIVRRSSNSDCGNRYLNEAGDMELDKVL
jgi:hypothetical protein